MDSIDYGHKPRLNELRSLGSGIVNKNNDPEIWFLKTDDIEENGYPKTQSNYQKYKMSYGLNSCYLMIPIMDLKSI